MDLLVLAKEPVPGLVKTRLTPPCSPAEAAVIAEAALVDTLAAATTSGADRVILALDGQPGPWCPPGVVIVGQGHGDLPTRLATAWRTTAGPAVQIGMDTPQVTGTSLAGALELVDRRSSEPDAAVLGLASDGGWWAIGFRRPHPGAFTGIATSRADTGNRQLARLQELGLQTTLLPVQRDVDTWDDALAVAAAAPHLAFAGAVRAAAASFARRAS